METISKCVNTRKRHTHVIIVVVVVVVVILALEIFMRPPPPPGSLTGIDHRLTAHQEATYTTEIPLYLDSTSISFSFNSDYNNNYVVI